MTEFRVEGSLAAIGILRTSRILIVGFCLGVSMFAMIAAYRVWGNGQGNAPENLPLLGFIGAGAAALMLILSGVLPGLLVGALRRQFDSDVGVENLLPLFQSQTMVGGALLDAGAFFNLIAFIIEKQWWSFGIAVVLLAGIVLKFPSGSQLENFVRQQTELIELERSGHQT